MAATVWTNDAKRMLFKLLPKIKVNDKQVGYYNQEWEGSRPLPPHITREEGDQVYKILLQQLIDSGVFTNKQPKSSSAVEMMVQHTLYPANNPNFRPLRHAFRFAAYYTGFMEMRDIVRIEEKATEKRGERSFNE